MWHFLVCDADQDWFVAAGRKFFFFRRTIFPNQNHPHTENTEPPPGTEDKTPSSRSREFTERQSRAGDGPLAQPARGFRPRSHVGSNLVA